MRLARADTGAGPAIVLLHGGAFAASLVAQRRPDRVGRPRRPDTGS
jgi:hypothetical protein